MLATGREGAQPPPSSAYRCLGVEIDPATASVTRSGERVELRPKALQVLTFLIEHRHRIVTKEEIFQHAWPGTSVVDATLPGCIQEIRRALADDAKDPRFIKTLPKVGYRFIAPLDEVEPPARTMEPRPGPADLSIEPSIPARTRSRRLVIVAGLATLTAAAAILTSISRRPSAAEASYEEAVWWKLNDTNGLDVRDSSRAAALRGKATGGSWAPGILGGALRLDGRGQRVEGIDRGNILPRGDVPRTLAAWVKVESSNGDITGILHFGSREANVYDSFRLLLLPDGHPSFSNHNYAGMGTDHSMAIATTRIDDGQWHQIAGTLAEGQGTIFVDGRAQNSVAMQSETKVQPDRQIRWALGNTLGGQHTGFRGTLDDVRIWRRGLRRAEIAALYRCTAGIDDVTSASGTKYFFTPVFDIAPADTPEVVQMAAGGGIVHTGRDYAGVQLSARKDDCAMESLGGANLGQDLSIAVELLVPRESGGASQQAGPYFRSRSAAPGDGIMGGSSAGYWVQLHSTGMVTVRCLNPTHVAAFTKSIDGFDSSRFHRLEVAIRGDALEAALDSKPLVFDQGGQSTGVVTIRPEWEGPPAIGKNHGAAGIAFSSEPLRPMSTGGQQARALTIGPYRSIGKTSR